MIYPWQDPVGYQELADLLRKEIHSGRYPPGQRLPSETSLSQTYDVSIKTARAAVRLLREEGLAAAVRGYGVVVQTPPEIAIIAAPPDALLWARNPTPQERVEYDIPEGWPVIVVEHPDGLQDIYPADRYRVSMRQSE